MMTGLREVDQTQNGGKLRGKERRILAMEIGVGGGKGGNISRVRGILWGRRTARRRRAGLGRLRVGRRPHRQAVRGGRLTPRRSLCEQAAALDGKPHSGFQRDGRLTPPGPGPGAGGGAS